MSLSDRELQRYARQIVLPPFGGVGQRRLKAASVLLIGAGAIGTAALSALAGAGIGRITIVDPDVVELNNLHRQFIFSEQQAGTSKAQAAADFAHALNSDIAVTAVSERIDDANAQRMLSGHDLVLDGSDNFATRLAVGDASVATRVPLVSAAAAQLQGQAALLRGWEDGQPCYRCFVGDAFDADDCDTCAEQGVIGALAAATAHFGALLAIRHLAGMGADAAGKLFVIDGIALRCQTIRLPKSANCRGCGARAKTA